MPRKSAVEYVSHNNSTVRIQRDGEDVQVIANNRLHFTFTADEWKEFLDGDMRTMDKVREVAALICESPTANDLEELCNEIDHL